jgi:TatA/E family protein of Tat protein translocase
MIVLVIVLLLFGAKRVPELAKGLGRGYASSRRVRKAMATLKWMRPPRTARSTPPASFSAGRAYSPSLVEGNFLELSVDGVLRSSGALHSK